VYNPVMSLASAAAGSGAALAFTGLDIVFDLCAAFALVAAGLAAIRILPRLRRASN
jgi:hypothetical protein